jgi:hypothetical protein
MPFLERGWLAVCGRGPDPFLARSLAPGPRRGNLKYGEYSGAPAPRPRSQSPSLSTDQDCCRTPLVLRPPSPFRTYDRSTSFFITEGGTRRPRPAGGAVGAPLPRGRPTTACNSCREPGTDFGVVVLVAWIRDFVHNSPALRTRCGVTQPRNTGSIPSAARLALRTDGSPTSDRNHGSRALVLLSFCLLQCSVVPTHVTESSTRDNAPLRQAAPSAAEQVAFKVDGVAGYPSGFALWTTSGAIDLLDTNGARMRSLDTGLTPITEVARSWDGWLIRGSSITDAGERGGIVLVRDDGSPGETWSISGAFWSMVSLQGRRIASDFAGALFELRNSAQPVRVKTESAGDAVELRAWGDQLVTCTIGSRHLLGNPEAICTPDAGPQIRDIWQDAPVACGAWLVADTLQNGATDSPRARTVWEAATASPTTTQRIGTGSRGLRCVEGMLIDSTPPGRVYRLPGLEPLGGPLCDQSGVAHVGVAGRNVLCVGADGRLSVRAHAF